LSFKYVTIRSKLLEEIRRQEPHAVLPTERDLADRYAVSRMTVRRAIRELVDEGLLYAVSGQGTFVSDPRISKRLELMSFSEEIRSRGLEPGSRIIDARETEAGEHVAEQLEIPPGNPVYEIVRVRLADELPMCLEWAYLPQRLFPELLEHDLSASLYEVLRLRYRVQISQAEQNLKAVSLSKIEADLLAVSARSPALRVARVLVDRRGRLIEYSVSLYRGDRYDFSLSVRRRRQLASVNNSASA
jgi:GntR family transcriptional regulator